MSSVNIYSILSSKPHNYHYLNRYIKFINYCSIQNIALSPSEYTERHHICPKAKGHFPEYKSFKQHPWNEIKLTRRQHILSHYMLAKCYNTWGMWEALKIIIHQRTFNHNDYFKLLKVCNTTNKQTKRGVFTRGYYEDGTPKVKQETKDLLSRIKKEYYTNPENRKKCKDIRKSGAYEMVNIQSSERFIALNKSRSGIPLSEETKLKISESVKSKLSDKAFKRSVKTFKLYVTPIGVFSSYHSPLCNLCKNQNSVINSHHTKGTSIITNNVKGLTFHALGFYIITKDHPEFEQYYERLGSIHPPEPNNPLSLELNDFLLQQKLLP